MARRPKTEWVALALALLVVQASEAVTVSLVERGESPDGTGRLDILIDTAGEDRTFANGGIAFAVSSSLPGVLRFTDAEIAMPTFYGGGIDRWSAGTVHGVSDDRIDDLFAFSVGTPGLNPVYPNNALEPDSSIFLFGSIGYELLDDSLGGSLVSVVPSLRTHPYVDRGVDVEQEMTFEGICLGGDCTLPPEPPTLPLLQPTPELPPTDDRKPEDEKPFVPDINIEDLVVSETTPIILTVGSFLNEEFSVIPTPEGSLPTIDIYITSPIITAVQNPDTNFIVITNAYQNVFHSMMTDAASPTSQHIPEPSTMLLAGLGALGFAARRRR